MDADLQLGSWAQAGQPFLVKFHTLQDHVKHLGWTEYNKGNDYSYRKKTEIYDWLPVCHRHRFATNIRLLKRAWAKQEVFDQLRNYTGAEEKEDPLQRGRMDWWLNENGNHKLDVIENIFISIH